MLSRTGLALGLLLAASTAAMAQNATETWRLGGLKMPESVIFDQANDRLIVGNMATFGPDGGADGYLSIVSPDGKLVTEQWATGLNDPKGMAIVGDKLYGPGTSSEFVEWVETGMTDALRDRLGHDRHALHAYRCTIEHPRTGERMTFTAPLAPDLEALWSAVEP